MPFIDPNDDEIEVNMELERLERENDYRGDLVSFSYDLVPATNDETITEICSEIYKKEAATIAEVRSQFRIPVYAIEPTTYYRAPEGEDGSNVWNEYEEHSDPHNKQIKEGASFGKSFNQRYGAQPEYIELGESIPTSDGGRLDGVVAILTEYLNSDERPDGIDILVRLQDALKVVDQSIWDGESLTRGSKWMCRNQDQKNQIDALKPQINEMINRNFMQLLLDISRRVVAQNRLRYRLRNPNPNG